MTTVRIGLREREVLDLVVKSGHIAWADTPRVIVIKRQRAARRLAKKGLLIYQDPIEYDLVIYGDPTCSCTKGKT